MLDLTTQPRLTDSVKTGQLDAPAGATVLRVEPVIPDEGWDKGLMVEVRATVNGRTERATLDMGYKTHPSVSWDFGTLLDGAKIEAEVIPVGGKASIGLRLTCAEADKLPAKRERPVKAVK